MSKIKIHVRRHEFNIACAPSDENAMRAAARLLEDKIDVIRARSRVADGERTAVMAALLIAFEAQKNNAAAYPQHRLDGIIEQVNGALSRTDSFLQGPANNGVNQ